MGWVGSVMDMGKTAYQTIQNPEDSMLDDEALQKAESIRKETAQKYSSSMTSNSIADKIAALDQGNSAKALKSKDYYNQVQGSMETVGKTIEGAATGGWVGAILGFVSGASKQVIGGIQAKKKQEKKSQALEIIVGGIANGREIY